MGNYVNRRKLKKNTILLRTKLGFDNIYFICTLLVVAAITVVAMLPILSCQALSFDDYQYLVENPLVQNPGIESAMRFLTEVLTPSTVGGYYQPFSMISLMIDFALGGRSDNLTVFHVTNLILHTLNTLLIMLICYLLFKNSWISGACGLLFGTHPMTVEVLAWITERKTLLAMLFVLLSLVFYLLHISSPDKKRFHYISVIFFVFSLLSKPTGIMIPFGLLILDWYPLKRLNKDSILEKIPYYVVSTIFAIITYVSQANTASVKVPAGLTNLGSNLIRVAHNIVFYLYKMLYPVSLSAHYPVPTDLSFGNVLMKKYFIAAIALIAIIAVSIKFTRVFAAGFLYFNALIFPTMGVLGFTIVIASDKYAYMPVLGYIIMVAALLAFFVSKINSANKVVKVIGIVLASGLLLGVYTAEIKLSRNYIGKWSTSQQLFEYMNTRNPNNPMILTELGKIFYRQGNYDESIQTISSALSHEHPLYDKILGYNSLGGAYFAKKMYKEARETFEKAVAYAGKSFYAYNNIGQTYTMEGNFEKALEYYKESLDINPNNGATNYNYGMTLLEFKRYEEALTYLNKSVQLYYSSPGIYYMLAKAYAGLDKLDVSRKYAEAFIQSQNNSNMSVMQVSSMYQELNKPELQKETMKLMK